MNPLGWPRWDRRSLAAVLVLVCALTAASCNKLKARDMLNKGVQAYKNGLFDAAIDDFQRAKALDPGLLNARLYLATAFASQYIPGAPSKDNLSKASQAIDEFQQVLQMDPKNLSAIDGIGSILYSMAATPFTPAKFEESKSYHLRHIAQKPDDPEPYYWVGVIDWTLSFRANSDIRAAYNNNNPRRQVRDDQPLPTKEREEYAVKYGDTVEDGIKQLQKAIALRPDYEDAMAYLNLLHRRKADQVASPQEREALLKEADELVEKVKEFRQKKSEAPAKP